VRMFTMVHHQNRISSTKGGRVGENKTQTMALNEEIAAQLKSNIESGPQ
jgi:hypothetical protein